MPYNKSIDSKKLDYIDFLRGFAIFTIVLMHFVQSYDFPEWLLKASSFGGAGVHVFFLCSGFGLYLSYLRKPLDYKSFIKRRFSKIYIPMAIICLVISFFMWLQGRDILMPLVSNLLLYKMFIPEHEIFFGAQMWFVSTIIQFYLSWPLLVRLIQWRYGIYTAVIISLGWATFTSLNGLSEERIWNSFFLQYLWEFCLGMKIAEVYVNNGSRLTLPKSKTLLPICIGGMILTGTMGWLGEPWKQYNDCFSLAAYLSLALILFRLGIKWLNRVMIYTNKFSYEWYLSHLLIFDLVTQVFAYLFGSHVFIIEIILCIVLSYTFAILFQWLLNAHFSFKPLTMVEKC